ncbi:hypothetical protein Taro_028963 [Colocasia esculenta]|uniref:Ribosome associated membrane protein RAMP4 n=1 Tax=Colocasia esculenta TaxID=4460 RepID=A0A843VHS5_COLES|nr:hypothetical protein [Colocasia esculenta]
MYSLKGNDIQNPAATENCKKHKSIRTTSRRLADRKVAKFDKNIMKRGSVPETTVKKGNDYPVGPILLGFFVFVVIGSCTSSSNIIS